MNDGYRSDLAAAQARIAELEEKLAGERGPNIEALEREHAALVRAVPDRARVRLVAGLAAFVTVISVASMVFLSSPYDHHPRFTIAMQMLTIGGMVFAAVGMWLRRASGLQSVALHERLLAAERARAALESRVRVGAGARVAAAEPLDAEEEDAAQREPMRR